MDQEERERILSRWTLQEKIRLLQGDTPHSAPGNGDFYPGLTLMDGPNGLRKAEEGGNSLGGIADTGRTTCFPCPTLLASTWDRDVLREVGKAIGRECLFFRVQVLLGPAVNIQRHPLCGRNFEYYSEDPLLSGEQAASFVQGVQEVSVGTTVKHLCCNNNEEMRFVGDSLVDERALREIYLRPFEIAIKKGRPTCVMNAYNRVNGVPASSSPLLNDEILRQEWGFDGLVMTDWGGIVDRVESLKAGTDLEMPGQCVHNERLLMQAVKEGKISESLIDQSVIRLLSTAEKTKPSADVSKNIFEENEQLAIDVATQGAVLLKNDGILPLSRDQRILAVGPFFENPRYQGSGSSLLNPFRLTTHRQAFERRNLRFSYAEGFDAYREEVDDKKEKEALRKAESADVVLFYGGQNDWFESEGFDRTSLSLPRNQLSLLEKLVERGKKVVFLLFTGSPVALPFRDKVAAILDLFLPGQGVGEATTRLLLGECNPSGRLTASFPLSETDIPFGSRFGKKEEELYKESIYVGYRYYLTAGKDVLYPFGYGLSYTEFSYSSLRFEKKEDGIEIRFDVANVGSRDGAEVCQVYVAKPASSLDRPRRELKAYRKVFLRAKEKKEVTFFLTKEDLRVFSRRERRFLFEEGRYRFEICRDCTRVLLSFDEWMAGERIPSEEEGVVGKYYFHLESLPKMTDEEFRTLLPEGTVSVDNVSRPYTMETPVYAYRSWFGRLFRLAMKKYTRSQVRKALRKYKGTERERKVKAALFIDRLLPVNCLRSLCFSSSGSLPYHVAEGLLELINGHPLKAIRKFCTKE